jgi:4-hydroxy-tetrahydrodipicolinate synthase
LKNNRLRGIIAPVVTPFDANEELNEKIFREEVKYLLSTGIHGISPGGSTGEGCAITDDELCKMTEIIQEENTNQIPVVVGVIRHSTKAAIKAGLAVKKAGATALMVTPISYLGGTDDKGNVEFYKRVSEETGMPIIIYNVVPQNEIKPYIFAKILEECPNVIGIKQSVGGIQAMLDMKFACGDKANIYCATDDMLCTGFELGADGAIAAILTVFPEESVRIWDAVARGDLKTGRALQDKLYPIWSKIKAARFPRGVKEALNIIGRNVGIPRSPVSGCTEYEAEEIKRVMKIIKGE